MSPINSCENETTHATLLYCFPFYRLKTPWHGLWDGEAREEQHSKSSRTYLYIQITTIMMWFDVFWWIYIFQGEHLLGLGQQVSCKTNEDLSISAALIASFVLLSSKGARLACLWRPQGVVLSSCIQSAGLRSLHDWASHVTLDLQSLQETSLDCVHRRPLLRPRTVSHSVEIWIFERVRKTLYSSERNNIGLHKIKHSDL